MCIPSTNDAWATLFSHAYTLLPSSYPSSSVAAPNAVTLAQTIDHTLLRLDASAAEIDQLCAEAQRHRFKSVCVRPGWVERATANVKGSDVLVCCVVGFHEGTARTAAKVQEAVAAVAAGAAELDMVLNIPALVAGDYTAVHADIQAVRTPCPAATLKVILETAQLSPQQIVAGSLIARAAGADFVKTSTGFAGRGASVADVQIMRAAVRKSWAELGVTQAPEQAQRAVRVKASGGVRSWADAVRLLGAGADRIGASAGVKILEEAQAGAVGAGSGTAAKANHDSSY